MGAAAAREATPLLRPRTIPQLFDAIVQIARVHAWDLFALSLIFHAPVHVFRILDAFTGAGSPIHAYLPEPRLGALWWTIWNSLAVSACAVATCQVYRDGRTSVRSALEAMRAGGWRLLGTIAAFELLVDGAWYLSDDTDPTRPFALVRWAILFVVFLAWCAPAIPAAAVEQVTPWRAIYRALVLVRRNFWRVAICVWIVWMITSLCDDALISLVGSLAHTPAVPRVVDFVVDGALYALRGIALAVVYFDCRVRREGYDVEHLLEGVRT